MANTHSLDLEASSSQYAYCADSPSLSVTADLTIEYWLKPESLPTTNLKTVQVGKYTASTEYSYSAGIRDDAGTEHLMYFSCSANGTDVSTAAKVYAFSTGNWYHLAFVFTASTGVCEFFLNGLSLGSASTRNTSGIYNGSANFTIGQINGLYYTDGLIDDVRIWSTVRTSGEISANYDIELVGDEANLVGYWKFNNNYLDETANNNDLTASGSPVFSSDTPFASATNTSNFFQFIN